MVVVNNGDEVAGGKAVLKASTERLPPRGYLFAIVVIALVLVIYTLLDFGWLPADRSALMAVTTDLLFILGTAIFLAVSLYGFVRSKNLRINDAMFGFSLASLSFCIASLLWGYYNFGMGVEVPYPSLADVFFIVGSLATIASIYSATRAIGESAGLRAKLGIAILIVATTASVLVAYVAFTDVFASGLTPLALVSVVYPSLDIVCLALAGNLIFTSVKRNIFESQVVITAGVAILSLSHIYFSVTASAGFAVFEPPAVTLFAVAYMLFAIGISRYVELTKADLVMERIARIAKVQNN